MNYITKLHIEYAYKKKRRWFKKYTSDLKKCGRNVEIGTNCYIESKDKFEIGDNCWIGDNFFAKANAGIVIGSGTIIARGCEIWTCNHNYDSNDLEAIPYDKRMIKKAVTIGENCWIGSRVTIIPGVKIGEGVVVGAGSVITKDIPDYAVIGGNPARVLKYRDVERYNKLKSDNKIYLDLEYDFDQSNLRKTQYHE